MENLGLAVGEGLVSHLRRAATMLESRVDDLSDLLAVHGIAQPAEHSPTPRRPDADNVPKRAISARFVTVSWESAPASTADANRCCWSGYRSDTSPAT